MGWILESILTIILLGAVFALGWYGNDMYRWHENKQEVAGLWMSGIDYEMAQEEAYGLDSTGQWVCINVNKDLSFDQIIETCTHEAGHELFARKCADNPSICFELIRELEDE